jgi:hypothetical protein
MYWIFCTSCFRKPNVTTELGLNGILVCGRHSRRPFSHVGNRRFRVTIDLNLPRYLTAKLRRERELLLL